MINLQKTCEYVCSAIFFFLFASTVFDLLLLLRSICSLVCDLPPRRCGSKLPLNDMRSSKQMASNELIMFPTLRDHHRSMTECDTPNGLTVSLFTNNNVDDIH